MKWPIIVAALVLAADQVLKAIVATLAEGAQIAVVPGFFWITHVTNTGISFGLFQGSNLLMIWLAIVIFGFLIFLHDKFRTPLERYAYWLVIAGLFGNLIDRIVRGAVVDLFDLGWWPVFNIADSAICIGVALLVIEEILKIRRDLLARRGGRSS